MLSAALVATALGRQAVATDPATAPARPDPLPAAAPDVTAPSPQRFEFTQVQMGTEFKLLFYAADAALANRAAEAAFARVAALDQALSDYRRDSDLNEFCRHSGQPEWQPLGDLLFSALDRAQHFAALSGGAFDPTVGPVVRLWRRARRQKELPSAQRIEDARRHVDYRQLQLDPESRRGRLNMPGMQLDLGGIGQGIAADAALAALVDVGCPRALVDASGDIALGDPPPNSAGWTIGVAPIESPDAAPTRYLRMAGGAVSSSGDLWQFVELGGRRYSHIVDPRTGQALQTAMSVTVVAPDCTSADALATAFAVLGPEAGERLLAGLPGCSALVVRREGEEIVEHTLGDFESRVVPANTRPSNR